jgi:uncharacterized membrane protein YdbT with pleckstrin-like domain
MATQTHKPTHENQKVAYIRSQLTEGETIKRMAEIHFGIYWKTVVVGIFTLFLFMTITNLGYLFALVTLVMGAIAWLTKHFLILALTDRRIFVRYGIIRLDTVQLRLSRIESVELERTIIGQILGYSTVVITGTGSRVTYVPFVAHGEAFRKEINEFLMKREKIDEKDEAK